MKIPLVLISLFTFTTSLATTTLEEAAQFFGWLEEHAKEFAQCEPRLEGGDYVLCDNTKVAKADLKKWFAMSAKDLIAEIRTKGLKVELICDEKSTAPALGNECVKAGKDSLFSEISSLHGKYLPEEKSILIRNSATPGSLVHESIHSLQANNDQPVYGKVYKKTRITIQRHMTELMDKKIAVVQKLEKEGKKAEAKTHVDEFMIASQIVRGFAPWQDLIDERGIFLLYLKYGKEFGATDADLALAKKNMHFICKNPKLTKLLPKKQCDW
jgi:hypothetical protein